MTDETTDKIIALIRRLDNATRQRLIDWKITDRQYAFVYSTASSSVMVSTRDDDGQLPYRIEVIDHRGNIIESLTSHAKSRMTGHWLYEEGGHELETLYERVRRAALAVDEKIDELLSGLPAVAEDEYLPEDD